MKPCLRSQNKSFCVVLICAGLITLVFGVAWGRTLPDAAHNLSMLSGMFAGMGGGLTALGAVWLIKLKVMKPETLRQEAIEQNDERNVQVRRMAYEAASKAATFIFAILAFILLWLDYRIPAILSIGALYLHFIVFLIAAKVADKKM